MTLKNLQQYLTHKTHRSTLRLFAIGLNIWIIINSVILSFGHTHFYSRQAFIDHTLFQHLSWFDQATGFLILWRELNMNFEIYPLMILLQLSAALIAIFQREAIIAQIVVAWTTLSLDQYAQPTLDGGNNLVQLMLIYLPLTYFFASRKGAWSPPFYNLLFLTMRLQVVVIYLTAGLSKIHGDLWTKGVALYYTMGVREYGHPALFELFANFPNLGVLFSYLTLAFQVSFAFLIWNRNLRPLILAVGTLFHLGIVFGMGLTSFGFAMCTSYLLFYTNRKSQQALHLIGHTLSLKYLHPNYYRTRIETHPLHV